MIFLKQKQKYRGMFETQKSRNKTSPGDIGLNIINYRCSDKNEIQSNYFQKTEVSIHVTILHRDAILELLSWIGCLTSQLTIFQSYMWRHIDVQADWRRSWTYGRAPNAIDIS